MRNIQDALLTAVKALPAAGATANTDAIDLGSASFDTTNEVVEVLLSLPATPALVDTKKITVTFQDSADGTNFAAIAELATLVTTGAGGVGAAAASRRVKLPGSTRRYLRASAAVEAAGGTNTAVSMTLKVLT